MKILLHTCCGPCAIYCADTIRKENHDICGFFYNPNIYPVSEYDKRKEAARTAFKNMGLDIIFHKDYSFKDFFRKCQLCWKSRLKQAAEFGKKENFDAFTTTLLISPYQEHEKIKQIGYSLENLYKIKFYYKDFRAGFRESHKLSKQMGLYHQKYCGCVYSERERIKSEKLRAKSQARRANN